MGKSLIKNYLHIIFSKKNRAPLIQAPHDIDLHNYLGGICKQLDCPPIIVGGYYDHVHILCMLSKKITLVELLEKLKKNSSKWMKMQDASLENFYWQDGYGAFSVNPSEIDTVIGYINNQPEYHNKKTFEDEYRAFLKKYKVDYDERYVWD